MDPASPGKRPAEIELTNFRFLEPIGQGGMGVVYLAEQLRPKRRVAIKVVPPDPELPPAFLEALKNEGDTAARFNHSNLPQVYECGIVDEHYYLAMEHLGGGDLAQRLQKGITPGSALRVVRDIASALSHVHSKGFVHRDVKPQNILFDEDGKPVLVDFGVAKVASSAGQLTSAGYATGTPAYMSPEQIQGHKLDGRTDLYSLGLVLYEALTGRRPFQGETAHELREAQVSQAPPPLPEKLQPFQDIVDALLAKRKEDRYSNAAVLVNALDELITSELVPDSLVITPVTQQTGFHRWTKEMRRRNVFRTVALYVAIGWGFTEIVQAALAAFGWSEKWGDRLVITFVGCFPLAVVVAWLYEARSGGPARDRRASPKGMFWVTAALGLALSVLVLIPVLKKEAPVVPLSIKPFDLAIVSGPVSGNEADLLLQGLIMDLERVISARSDLRILSSRAAEQKIEKGEQISRLPVSRIVEVAAQRTDDVVQLRVSLQSAQSGEILWTDSLEEHVDNFLALQERLAEDILAQLSSRLKPGTRSPAPELDAYLAFQRARQTAGLGGKENVLAALELAKRAIGIDPDYDDAKALLGNLYLDVIESYPVAVGEGRRQLNILLDDARNISEELTDQTPERVRLAWRLESRSYLKRDGRGWQPEDAVWPMEMAITGFDRFPGDPNLVPIAIFASLSEAAPDYEKWREARTAGKEHLASALIQHATDLELLLTHAAFSDNELERLTDLASAYPDELIAIERLGWALYDEGSLARAADTWVRAFDMAPNTISARTNLLRILVDLQFFELAALLLDRYFDETVVEAEFSLLAAFSGFSQGDADSAKSLLQLAANRTGPSDPMPCLTAVGEIWGATEPFDQLVTLDTEQLVKCDRGLLERFGDSLRLHLALHYQRTGQQDLFEATLNELAAETNARQRIGNRAADHHLMAAILSLAGETETALSSLEEAERLGWRRYLYTQWHPAFAGMRDDENFSLVMQGLKARVNQQRSRFNETTVASMLRDK